MKQCDSQSTQYDAVIVQTALEFNLHLETYDDRQARAWEKAKGS